MNDDAPSLPSRRSFIGTSLAVTAGVGVGVALVKTAPARAARGARFDPRPAPFPSVR
jgi:hypothetical protein